MKKAALLMIAVLLLFGLWMVKGYFFEKSVDLPYWENAENQPIFPPEEWTGRYYPAYIPEGYEVDYYYEAFHSIELVLEDGHRILFSELDPSVTEMRGTEGAEVYTIQIHGADATVIDGWHNGIHNVTIVWQISQETWFDLVTYKLDTEEAIRIAKSVRRIP